MIAAIGFIVLGVFLIALGFYGAEAWNEEYDDPIEPLRRDR